MESLWFLEYDVITFDTDFVKINFQSLLEQAVSDPEALNLAPLYSFSNNKFENVLQKYLAEFLEISKNFFQDLLEISENENLMNFSKTVLLYIQVERLYFLTYWRVSLPDFLINRLISSYFRVKNLLSSFHVNCFPKLYRSKELNETLAANTGPRHRKRYSLTRSDQGSYDLLFKRSEELKFFQTYLCNTFEIIIKECKKLKHNNETLANFFKKMLHYSKNIINKNAFYLKQENENLFGNAAEKQLVDKILLENKTKLDIVRKEIERERSVDVRTAKNSTNPTSIAKPPQFSSKKPAPSLENPMLKSIIQETEEIHRKVSIKLSENDRKASNKLKKKATFFEEEEKKPAKSERAIASMKSKGLIPPPPPAFSKQKEKFTEDPQIRESIMKSLTNYFARDDKEKYQAFVSQQESSASMSRTTETLIKIRSNITDIIDEQKISKYKTLNDKLQQNLEKLINELAPKKRTLNETYQKFLMDSTDLFARDSKRFSNFLTEKHHSIEMVSGNKFSQTPESLPKLSHFRYISSGNDDEIATSQRNKLSELNVIKEREETELKDEKITEEIAETQTNLRNTHAFTALSSPLLRQSQASNTGSFPLSLWNFIRKSLLPTNATNNAGNSQRITSAKPKTQNNSAVPVIKTTKLNISEKDIIKIDSNTEIYEELKFVQTVEKMAADMIKDEDLFEKSFFTQRKNSEDDDAEANDYKLKEKFYATFLSFLKSKRDEEILKKNSVFFMPEPISIKSFFQSNSSELTGGTKSKVFNAMVKIRQVQNEIQNILKNPLNEAACVERTEKFSIKRRPESVNVFNILAKDVKFCV